MARERRRVTATRWVKEGGSAGAKTLKLPEGVTLFKPKPDSTLKADFLSWIVGKGNPMADAGEEHFELTHFVHFGIGNNNAAYICPAMSRNDPCPICEERQRLFRSKDKDDQELAKKLRPKKRQLWCLIDVEDRKKGVQIMEISDYAFGDVLRTKIEKCDVRDYDKYNCFADLDDGSTLRIVFAKKNTGDGGKDFAFATDIEFRDREQRISKETIKKIPCLEDCLIIHDYEKLKNIFTGAGVDEEPDEEGRVHRDDDREHRRGDDRPSSHRDDDDERDRARASRDDDDRDRDRDRETRHRDDPPATKRDDERPRASRDDDERGRRDDRGSDKPKKEFAIGNTVIHDQFGECEIVYMSRDKTRITIEDQEAKEHVVSPEDIDLASSSGRNGASEDSRERDRKRDRDRR